DGFIATAFELNGRSGRAFAKVEVKSRKRKVLQITSVNHQVANALLTISRAAAEHFLQLWKPKTSLPYAPIHSHFVFNGKCSATTIVVIANARTAGFHPRERAGRDRSCGGFQQPDYHPQEVFPYPNRSDARG